ncbi:Cleavage and polyadenylation specificity factor subunit 1 [Entomortierella beljakovae]|nr:Cleavage and polyadenylation specificity factor subunit 1 [Entomortierella beljakovae]
MSMYTLAKELFPPTGIERVVRCNFIRPDVLNVVVSKSTVLEIYNFTEPAQADQLPRLELVASYRLNGIITSMGVIRTSSSGQHGLDSILVSFKDAKQEFLNNSHPTEIRVDPSRRCAVLAFYGDRLAVLPFRQDESSITDEDDVSNRLAVRKDTCSLVVVSLDITHKLYPIIYSIDNLPYDCTKVIAIPKPIGGLLVVSANALIHLDQGSTGLGVAVNGYTPLITEYPLQSQHHFDIALEGSNHVFLAPDQILFTLRSGDMYVVELQQEGRSLSGFKIEKAGASMQTSCKCSLGTGYYFVGSRYADSMLIKYSTKDQIKKKKKRAAIPVTSMDLEEDLYGQDVETIEVPTDKSKDEIESAMDAGESKWQFEICDTLTNTGPILDFDIGHRASNESHAGFPPQHELVAATGSGQNGALVVFQRNIRPNVIRSTEALAGSNALWTVYCRKEITFEGVSQFESRKSTTSGDGADESYDKLLIVSRENSTLVLATSGDDLRQLPNSQFYSEGPTVEIGTLFEETRIVQVYSGGIRLLNADCRNKQTVPIGGHQAIMAASISDPYILLQLRDGSALLLKGDPTTRTVTLLNQPSILNNIPIKSCCIYADTLSTMLTVEESPTMAFLRSSVSNKQTNLNTSNKMQKKLTKKQKKEATKIIDDIDLDLYGPEAGDEEEEEGNSEDDDDTEMGAAPGTNGDVPGDIDMEDVQSKAQAAMANPEGKLLQATHWCFIYRVDGALEIYHLPDFKEVFFSPHFDLLPEVLADSPAHQDTKSIGEVKEISEMVVVNMGAQDLKGTYIVARSYRGNIAVYKTYQHFPTKEVDSAGNQIDISDRLAIRFRKIPLDVVARETPPDEDQYDMQNGYGDDNIRDIIGQDGGKARKLQRKSKNLIPFTDVAGYEGVFGNLRISRLPEDDVHYDMTWPIRKVPLKKAVRHIKYHPTSHTYVTVTAIPDPFILKEDSNVTTQDGIAPATNVATNTTGDAQRPSGSIAPTAPVMNGTTDSNGQPKPKANASGFYPSSEKQTLELVSPVTWETVDRYELNEYEIVTSMETVSLESSQDASGRKKFIAVGTSYIKGEDSAMRGAIYIFDIIDVVPEPNNPQTDHKLKLLHSEEAKGAVTAMAGLCGYLLTCVGAKVFVQSFEDNETLTGVAFLDVQIYVTSVKVVKNTVMLADAYKSVWFAGFQDLPAKLVLLGKDYNPMESVNVSYIIENQTLNMVIADSEKNVRLFQYDPFNVQSFSGQKLLCRGDYHIGSQIEATISVPKIVLSGSEEGISHLTICGTLDGSLTVITPIPEKTSKRLHLLGSQIVNGVQHPAGLNPRAFRLLQSKDRLSSNPTKGILDGDLLFEFITLPVNRQKEITKQIGTGVDRVMDDLAAIAVAADHF